MRVFQAAAAGIGADLTLADRRCVYNAEISPLGSKNTYERVCGNVTSEERNWECSVSHGNIYTVYIETEVTGKQKEQRILFSLKSPRRA